MNSRLCLAGISTLALWWSAGCRSLEPQAHKSDRQPEPFVPLPDEEPQTIGYFLAQFDRSLLQWSEYRLAAAGARDQNALVALEANMQKRARERRIELLDVLETGSPQNRRTAAAALGFAHDPSVLGPLVACLGDPDEEVVQKTLLGLGVLALPETPIGEIARILVQAGDPWTRNNAAYCLLALARAGNTTPAMAEACRSGLRDTEAGVRAQCASGLGLVSDPGSTPGLIELLRDPDNLVALAAAAALAQIGRTHAEHRGTTARALVAELDTVEPDRRRHLLGALSWLAGTNRGEDTGAWAEWARNLP